MKTAARRVFVLVPDAFGQSGGIAQFNRHLIEALLEPGDLAVRAVALLGPRHCPIPRGLGWSVPRHGSKVAFALGAAVGAMLHRPHLVIGGHSSFGPLSLALKRLARARLWTVTHGVEVWEPGSPADNAALVRSDLVSTVSGYTRSKLLAWCAIDPARVEVLHNTIDLARFRPGPRPRGLVERYGVAGHKVLLTVSRLSEAERYKGHDRVIPILAPLRERIGPLRYVIAGTGDDRPRLERLVEDRGARDLVTFAGFVPDDELEAHYRLADAFVMPSTGEGFGIVFLEALACGCPVVAGNRDGSVDALRGGELGRLVDPDSADDLLSALTDVLAAGRAHDAPVRGVEAFAIPRFRARVDALARRALGALPRRGERSPA